MLADEVVITLDQLQMSFQFSDTPGMASSGVPTPNECDKAITTWINEALAFIDIRLLDHVIVSNQGYVSFAQEGLLF